MLCLQDVLQEGCLVLSIRLLSMLISAMSLTMTAHLNSSSSCFVSRMCFRRVVFPEPRNPQSRVTGTRLSASGVCDCPPRPIFGCQHSLMMDKNPRDFLQN